METEEINSFKKLFNYADFSTIYVDTEPKIINPEDIDINTQKKYADVRVAENNDTYNKIIVKPTNFLYSVKLDNDVAFTNPETQEVHLLNKYDTVLMNQINGKWKLEIIDDTRNFTKRFEEVDYNSYKIEESSIEDLRNTKSEILKKSAEQGLQDFKEDLKEKSTMKIGLIKLRN
jgi:hypothetical protein